MERETSSIVKARSIAVEAREESILLEREAAAKETSARCAESTSAAGLS